MNRRIRTLIRKEFIELLRTPRLIGLVVVAPIIQLTMLGYAATTDVKNVPIVVVDGDRSPRSRQLIERFAASPYFRIVGEETDPGEVDADLARGRAWLAIVVPSGFGEAVSGHGPDAERTVQVLADGTDANSSGVALAYAAGLVSEFDAAVRAELGGPDAGPRAAIESHVRVWFNPQLESKDFMLPGVVALLLLAITTSLSSMAIVRERELGTLEQLNVTPLGRWELILGKLLPYALVGFIDVLLVLSVAVFWFEVPLRGSVWLLLGACAIYLLCTLGLGLLVSTISSTQQQAMMTATFFFLVPMIYLSGFIFPIENMPRVIQAITTIVPLKYFLIIVRGIFLKGVGWSILWPQFAALALWGVTVLALAAVRSHKRA
jgi:ABC-2 type transport system permease protein